MQPPYVSQSVGFTQADEVSSFPANLAPASFATDGKNLNTPSGKIVGTYGYVPAGYTSADIKYVAAWLAANGGGTVHLQSTIYTGSTGTSADDINCALYPGVSFIGTKPKFTSTGNVSIATEVYLSGTNLVGFGFYGNNTPLGSPIANFGSNALQGIQIKEMLISNSPRRALDFGATNSMGLNLCDIDVVLMDCGPADYAASLVNFANCDNINITSLNSTANPTGGGIKLEADVSSAIFIPGNSGISVFAQTYFRLNTGIVYNATANSSLNSLKNKRIQDNKYGQSAFTQNAVFTSSSASIAVTNCEELPVGMPVMFTTTANGVTLNTMYVVTSRSVATGAGNITVATDIVSANITATGSSTLTLQSSGWPCLTVSRGGDGNSYVLNSNFDNLDLESINAVQLYAAGTKECKFYFNETGASNPSIVLRNTAHCATTTNNPSTKFDFDAVSANTHTNHGWYSSTAQNGCVGAGFINGHVIGLRGGSAAIGAAAGTGATISETGGKYGNTGQFTITTGTSPTTGVVATYTFAVAKENSTVVISPANAAANALSGATQLRPGTATTGANFTLNADTALAASTVYVYNWMST